MMDPIMLVYKMNDKVVTMAIEHNGTLASMVSMCREFGYPYEVYARMISSPSSAEFLITEL